MGWRFRRSFRIAPGVRLNVSKRGVGVSAGVKGFRIGVGPRGMYRSISIPGTGLYRIDYAAKPKREASKVSRSDAATSPGQAAAPAKRKAPDLPGKPVDYNAGAESAWLLVVIAFLLAFWKPLLGVALAAFAVVLRAWQDGNPKFHAAVYLERAKQSFNDSKFNECVQAALECLRLAPEATQAHYLAGHALLRLGRAEEAAEHLTQVDSDDGRVTVLAIEALEQAGRIKEALELFAKLPRDILDSTGVRNWRASLLIKSGQPDLAIEILREGPTRKKINGDPDLLELHYLLGLAYEAVGKKANAKRAYMRVLADTPGYRDADERLAALAGNRVESEDRTE